MAVPHVEGKERNDAVRPAHDTGGRLAAAQTPPGSKLPSAATHSAPQESLPIWRMAGRSNTLRLWPRMRVHARPNFTTGTRNASRPMRSSESGFENGHPRFGQPL